MIRGKSSSAKLVYDEETCLLINKEDLSYGITTNEKSYNRGVKANKQISSEVIELCEVRFINIFCN